MKLSWNQIKDSVLNFSKEWARTKNEFQLYEKYTANLFTKEKVKKK